MKKIYLFIIIVLFINTCKTPETIIYKNPVKSNLDNEIIFSLIKGKSYNHPSFVIWLEDIKGNYIETLFITKSYASGIFKYQMTGDSIWINEEGKSYQPAALPYWTNKKGLVNNKDLVPSIENPFIDAFTGATPTENLIFETSIDIKENEYRLLLEVNQAWDWNKYWTNNLYPDNRPYKNSAQPSIIYLVILNHDTKTFYMNPIGHGNPKGEDGKLFTNLNTLTTAKDIFHEIKVEIK